MSILGRLLRHRHADENHLAWHLPNLHGPDGPTLTSRNFGDGDTMPKAHCAKYIGGANLSPHLAWDALPAGAAQLLLVVEDVDVPTARPAVHCVALIDPAAAGSLEPGALARRQPGAGVRLLRSAVGRGYQGPAPIAGHGPHRYVFQLFALADTLDSAAGTTPPERIRPRALLPAVTAPVLGRARLTGVYER
ncbi:YbhB/YbcL family Raf kinase inhibitor-like protein [Nocardia sp. alder85J]|uniref:YbhB/YbcL family Raf kinase inhibitor-like protein n=1 Tax=Nocardia sp. alder85J TaxID=2862949 RepID=UPI001CD72994|nr:YbhB/YbcL family Raf kinase inhibitor-like protein [Nocardia sp. alder85J]MCX4099182.1 YbhB/YbcL family Raf kinase inhibitor-like protein [Nocardia sp. alder85J]